MISLSDFDPSIPNFLGTADRATHDSIPAKPDDTMKGWYFSLRSSQDRTAEAMLFDGVIDTWGQRYFTCTTGHQELLPLQLADSTTDEKYFLPTQPLDTFVPAGKYEWTTGELDDHVWYHDLPDHQTQLLDRRGEKPDRGAPAITILERNSGIGEAVCGPTGIDVVSDRQTLLWDLNGTSRRLQPLPHHWLLWSGLIPLCSKLLRLRHTQFVPTFFQRSQALSAYLASQSLIPSYLERLQHTYFWQFWLDVLVQGVERLRVKDADRLLGWCMY